MALFFQQRLDIERSYTGDVTSLFLINSDPQYNDIKTTKADYNHAVLPFKHPKR